MRTILLAVVLGLSGTVLLAQEAEHEPFDAAAALKAASQPLDQQPGQKLSSFSVAESLRDKAAKTPVRIALSRDGKRLLAFGKGYQVYDAETGKLVSKEPTKPLPAIPAHTVISPDGKIVACIVAKRFMALEVATGKELKSTDIGDTPIAHLAFSDDRTCRMLARDTVLHEIPIGQGESKTYSPDKEHEFQGRAVFGAPGSRFLSLPVANSQPELFLIDNGHVAWASFPRSLSFRPQRLDMATVSNRFLVYGNGEYSTLYFYQLEPKPPRTNFINLGSSPLRSGYTASPDDLAISSDEKWLLYTTQQHVEVRSLDTPRFPTVHKVDLGTGYQAAAPDAARVAGITFRDVVVYQLPMPKESPPTALIGLLGRLLKARQFEQLEQLAALVATEDKPFPWAVDQEKYNTLVQLMLRAGNSELKHEERMKALREWRKERSDSHFVRILLAQQALNNAWEARGGGAASEVTWTGRMVFTQQMENAHDLVKPLLDDDQAPLEMYTSLFDIAKAQGWSEEDCEPHIAKLLDRNPRYLTPHIAMAE